MLAQTAEEKKYLRGICIFSDIDQYVHNAQKDYLIRLYKSNVGLIKLATEIQYLKSR